MTKPAAPIPAVTRGPRDPRPGRPPFWVVALLLLGVIASWIPLAVAARARVARSDEPRIALVQDMAYQPKLRPQSSSDTFADGRAMRPRPDGVVARGRLEEDDHYYRGFTRKAGESGREQVTFFEGFPEQVKVTPELLSRGQQRFNIYCAACHGQDGSGDGPVHRRADELQKAGVSGMTWVPPANLHSDVVRGRPEGHIYNTINVGIRNMPAYGGQIPPEDRWAIVAYVRALQLSQDAPAEMIPQEKLDGMK